MSPHDVAIPPHYIHEGFAVGAIIVSWIFGMTVAASIWHPNRAFRQGLQDGLCLRFLWDRRHSRVATKEMRVRRKLRHRRDRRMATEPVASTTIVCPVVYNNLFETMIDGKPISVVWETDPKYQSMMKRSL